ncbi:MAG: MarR family transcriptional regulator [Sneathiella sp.]|nr:MarR family transcriptional regulator [Sneathiella sp.]
MRQQSQSLKTSPSDEVVKQWQQARPDLDPRPMAVCGDIWRIGDLLKQGVLANLKPHKLDFPQFDVLMTLRRQPEAKHLSPSELAGEMMLSASAMTNRLDRLEARGFIQRVSDPSDRRSQKIALTKEGFDIIDSLVSSHLSTEEGMLAPLSQEEREQLRGLISKLLAGF